MTINELSLVLFIASVAIVVGIALVQRRSPPAVNAELAELQRRLNSDSGVSRALVGAPFTAVIVLACMLFVIGFGAGLRNGIVVAFKAGLGMIIYFSGFIIVTVPFVMIGGLIGLFVRKKR